MTLYDSIYDYLYNIVFAFDDSSAQYFWGSMSFNVLGADIDGSSYITHLLTLGVIILIFVLCCLFVYKIIKLLGNLIR